MGKVILDERPLSTRFAIPANLCTVLQGRWSLGSLVVENAGQHGCNPRVRCGKILAEQ